MKKDFISWLLFIALSFIWGSSFILMKIGLRQLTAYQVAAIRIASSGIVLLPVAIRHIKKIPKNKLLLIFLSGFTGNLVPAFLFCLAEQSIDSSLSGTLNSLTPIFVIVIGSIFFNAKASWKQITGVIISFTGTALLFFGKGSLNESHDIIFAFFVVFATILYGLNVNIVHKYLDQIESLQIASVALSLNAIPALIILILTDYFSLPFNNKEVLVSTGAASILGIVGTAIATILFYKLLKRAGTVFSSMVTYGMPVVAIFWGYIANEDIGWRQIGCLIIILIGVYWANRNKIKPA
jgi:drug/metabolite transporter (DMT)-like permease